MYICNVVAKKIILGKKPDHKKNCSSLYAGRFCIQHHAYDRFS